MSQKPLWFYLFFTITIVFLQFPDVIAGVKISIVYGTLCLPIATGLALLQAGAVRWFNRKKLYNEGVVESLLGAISAMSLILFVMIFCQHNMCYI